ncbi:unnamed protein product [Cyclocybe aegerita]|uniref:5'-nucleotidase n=1 Tax=Cyclocybe aegerita TaxID=1973307 RepID=A0A8S0X5P3_CYCAE|nr:unnamed protein product [Cyclocybe aegerita]
MVPVLNSLNIDVSVTGNHDFDFGYPHLSSLIKDIDFVDSTTSKTPEHLKQFVVLERAGVRIGIIGLVEEAWITTVASWPPEFHYQPMKEIGLELSQVLRDPKGEYQCDIIIALTHSRLPNDIDLAKELFALSPSGQSTTPIASEHGVDIILGGHDHLYFVGRGVTSWDGFDVNEKVLGAESDEGDVLVIKSGSDFRDLSEINLELIATPEGSVRRRVISKITGKRHTVKPEMRSSESLAELLKDLMSSVSSALKAPVCMTEVMIDVRSYFIRVQESPVANWFADIARYAYDDTLCIRGCGGSDGVLLCAGTFRGDSTYGPGPITIGDILEILPFEDPIVVLEVDGATLWDALESSLRMWPAQEGRFPAVSGFRISLDSSKEPGNRVLGIWVLKPNNGQPGQVEEEEVKRETDGRKYKLVTREYMAQGHDGFSALTRGKWLIDHECGSTLSTIVRRYFLGSQFVNKMLRLQDGQKNGFLNVKTKGILEALHQEAKPENSTAINLWKQAVGAVIQHTRSRLHYQQYFNMSATEHMSSVDAFDGGNARKGHACTESSADTLSEDLLVVHPVIDGRLKDEGKAAPS